MRNSSDGKRWRNWFYKTKRWRALRYEALVRDRGLCKQCEKHGIIKPAIDVDHILPRDKYPHLEHSLENLRSLCKRCHGLKTRADESGVVQHCKHGYPMGVCCKASGR